MGLFWKRKSGDQFVSLKLNEPLPEKTATSTAVETPETPADKGSPATAESVSATSVREAQALRPDLLTPSASVPGLEPVPSGAGPTPLPTEPVTPKVPAGESHPPVSPRFSEATQAQVSRPRPVAPVPSRSPFATSVLGLNLSMEELQAQEAALEQEFSARFRRAVAATRESLSERLDTVFQGLKQIDENLLDELEEALIAADIGVATTHHILETVRRGVARKQINDLDALKQAIKDELLKILRHSEKQGVASETNVPENVSPYVMIVGVNGVGKTTTIGKLAQRIKAEGNDVLICAADTFRAAASDQLAIWAER